MTIRAILATGLLGALLAGGLSPAAAGPAGNLVLDGNKLMLNPQPLPPGSENSINPQPLPPGTVNGFNPQPDPPGRKNSLNPQPLPPGIMMGMAGMTGMAGITGMSGFQFRATGR